MKLGLPALKNAAQASSISGLLRWFNRPNQVSTGSGQTSALAGLTRLTRLTRLTQRNGRAGSANVVVELRNDRLLAVRLGAHGVERAMNIECAVGDRRSTLERMRRDGWFKGAQTELMLGIGQRQLNTSPKPPVADAELREALRWQLRDALDYPPEEAVLDVLPVADTEPPGRQEVLVFTGRRTDLAQLVTPFVDARVPLRRVAAIDCAQRNLAWHGVAHPGATAVLMPCDGGALCTVSRGEQLILSRAIEIGSDLAVGTRRFEQAAEHMALQMQRTFDLLERRSADAAVANLVVADWGSTAPLFLRVAELTSQHVQSFAPAAFVAADSNLPSPEAAIEYLHLIGACLHTTPEDGRESALRPLQQSVTQAPFAAQAASIEGDRSSDSYRTYVDDGAQALNATGGIATGTIVTVYGEDETGLARASDSNAAQSSDDDARNDVARNDVAQLLSLEAGLVTHELGIPVIDTRPDGVEETAAPFAPEHRADLDFLSPEESGPVPVPPTRAQSDALGAVIESDPNLFLVTNPQDALAEELRNLAARREQESSAAPAAVETAEKPHTLELLP